jgi:GT2 family glycosyltransferase
VSARALRLSVVVPSYKRVDSLTATLHALCEQSLPRTEFEVIVSDDGSPEPIAPSIEHFSQRLALRVVRGPNAGPAAARNRGARNARAPIVAFTDDDCIPTRDWLANILARARQSPGHLIGGAITNTLLDDPYANATQLVMSGVYDYYSRFSTGQRFFSTTNLAVPAERFWVIGGFAEEFGHVAGEDYDFCSRWQIAGFPSVYAPEALVGHAHGHTLATFWRQHFGYGRGLLRVRQLAARRKGRRGLQLEAPKFYAELLSYPLREKTSPGARRWRNAGLVLLSQIATVAGAASELMFGKEIATSEPRVVRPQSSRTPQTPSSGQAKQRTSRTSSSDSDPQPPKEAQRSSLKQPADRGQTDVP